MLLNLIQFILVLASMIILHEVGHFIACLIFGIPGLILFILSLFTDHTVTYYNENLYLANPLTILFIPLGIMFAYENKFSFKWLSLWWYILTLFSILLFFLYL